MGLMELIRLCGFDELWMSLELDFHEKPYWREKYRTLFAQLRSYLSRPGEDALMLTSLPMANLTENSGILCDWDRDAYIVGEDIFRALGITPLDLNTDFGDLIDERPARVLARYFYEILHWGDHVQKTV